MISRAFHSRFSHRWIAFGLLGMLFAFSMMEKFAFSQEPAREHPLVPALKLAEQSYAEVLKITDYETTLLKREFVGGKLIDQRIALKFKEQPFSTYLKFEKPDSIAGREILFVNGFNDNKLLVKEASGLAAIVGTISLATDSSQVMAENRHAITDIGIKRLLEQLITQWREESQFGEIDVTYYPDASIGNAPCEVIAVTHPRPRKQFRYHLTRLYIEKQTRLPIRIENYGFPQQAGQQAQLLEEYTYVNLRTNVGLTSNDFDPRNPNYSFQRK